MMVLEKQKHLKPFMTQAMTKLSGFLNQVYTNFSNGSAESASNFTVGDSNSEERITSAVNSELPYTKARSQASDTNYHQKFLSTG